MSNYTALFLLCSNILVILGSIYVFFVLRKRVFAVDKKTKMPRFTVTTVGGGETKKVVRRNAKEKPKELTKKEAIEILSGDGWMSMGDILQVIPMSCGNIYNHMGKGNFPKAGLRKGPKHVRWSHSDLRRFIKKNYDWDRRRVIPNLKVKDL